jgi:hypothetical protein
MPSDTKAAAIKDLHESLEEALGAAEEAGLSSHDVLSVLQNVVKAVESAEEPEEDDA